MLKITIPKEVMRFVSHRQSENKGKMAVVKVQMIILSQFLDNSAGNLFRASIIKGEFDWYSIVHINVAVAMTNPERVDSPMNKSLGLPSPGS